MSVEKVSVTIMDNPLAPTDDRANAVANAEHSNRVAREKYNAYKGDYPDVKLIRKSDGSVWRQHRTPSRTWPRTVTQIDRGEPAIVTGGDLVESRVDSTPRRGVEPTREARREQKLAEDAGVRPWWSDMLDEDHAA